MTLPKSTKDLLKDWSTKPLFAHIATVDPSGAPHSALVWAELDGSYVKTAGPKSAKRHKNLQHESRVALTVVAPQDLYRALHIRGVVVELDVDGGLSFLDKMASSFGLRGVSISS